MGPESLQQAPRWARAATARVWARGPHTAGAQETLPCCSENPGLWPVRGARAHSLRCSWRACLHAQGATHHTVLLSASSPGLGLVPSRLSCSFHLLWSPKCVCPVEDCPSPLLGRQPRLPERWQLARAPTPLPICTSSGALPFPTPRRAPACGPRTALRFLCHTRLPASSPAVACLGPHRPVSPVLSFIFPCASCLKPPAPTYDLSPPQTTLSTPPHAW